MSAVDVCRINKHDNPDLVYGRHDGTILKRLLAAFSFRPTVVATMPISNIFSNNPYAQNARPTVTSIPMINVRLLGFTPSQIVPLGSAADKQKGYTNLEDAVNQVQTFIEGNVLVNRATNLLYSREVLFFYVDRRAHVMNLGMNVFNMEQLPKAVSGFERINTTEVYAPCIMKVGGDNFYLRSVVSAKTTLDTKELSQTDLGKHISGGDVVIGSETIFINCKDNNPGSKDATSSTPLVLGTPIPTDTGRILDTYDGFVYDPVRRWTYDSKSTRGEGQLVLNEAAVDNTDRVQKKGVIFMYVAKDQAAQKSMVFTSS
jgi:hypothetical protein